MMSCTGCDKLFCYICNKPIKDDEHYYNNHLCKFESNPFNDL